MAPQLTLYGNIASHYTEKVELALKEGNISHKYYLIDLANRPAFFTEQVNSIRRVPAITYGGPDVPPDQPSPLSFKLAESNVILEFLAEAYPDSKLMPTDPIQRAQVRFFVDAITRKYAPAFMAWILDNELDAAERLLEVIEFIQGLLSESGEYAVGDNYTIADACMTPFVHRLRLLTENDIGKFPVGNGPKLGESLKDPKYAKFVAYGNTALERPAAKEIYAPKNEILKAAWTRLFGRGSTFQPCLEQVQGRA